jgi:hypothetical protein
MYNSGFRSNKRTPDGVGSVAAQAVLVAAADPQPTITGWSIQGSDDKALDPAGGQTVVVKGNGFTTGMTVTVGSTAIGSVTIVSSTQATFTSPAKASGNYTLTMANSNGQAAILVPGLAYSTIVTWTTPAGSIGTTYETAAFTESVVATSDSAITYTLASGSLPTNATLNSNGTITGTANVTASPTTYSFSVTATDVELQDSTQSFTITVAPDAVTWVSPANGTSYSVTGNQPIANVSLSATAASGSGITYSANALPTGLSLTGNVIYGTPTVAQTVSTLLTATANTTTRSATETISWTINLGDIYWPYVSMLLNGSTPTTTFINDASLNNYQLTIGGDTKPNLFSPYTAGYYSNYFDGSSSYLSTSVISNAIIIGTSSFTIEFWVYHTKSGVSEQYLDAQTNGFSLSKNTSNQVALSQAGVSVLLTTTGTVPINQWAHIAVVRNGTAVVIYINGVSAGSATLSTNFNNNDTYIGRQYGAATAYLAGYVSNLRWIVGTAVYTSAFTPPTSPLTAISGTQLLTCRSNRFVDISNNNYVITANGSTTVSSAYPFVANSSYASYGSQYCPTTASYLTVNMGGTQAFGTGDFTVECWVYNTASAHNICMAATATTSWELLTYGSQLYWHENGGNLGGSGYGTIILNAWSHFAVSRASGTLKMFINGVQVYSAANTYNYSNNSTARYIGPANGGTAGQYISDFRVINGTGLYTTAFTPPTAPLTPVTNTQLLTCQYNGGANNNGFVDQSSFNNIITRSGNTTQGTFSPYSQTGWSNYFNGSTDAFTTATSLPTIALSANYTIEMWVYPTTLTANTDYWLAMYNNTGGSGSWGLTLSGQTGSLTAKVSLWMADFSTAKKTTTLTVAINRWSHIAVVRNSGVNTIYVNGVADSSPYSSSIAITTNTVSVGYYSPSSNGYYNGYISNLRIVNGTAVYTTNFTPSTTPLTPITNTNLLTCQSNRFVDNSSGAYALTLAGTPTVQAYSPFGGVTSVPTSYSNYFNGSTDYFTVPATTSTGFNVGTGDFTVEAWVYLNNAVSTQDILAKVFSGTSTLYFQSGKFRWYSSGNKADHGATTISVGVWYHVAAVRSSGTVTVYLNGTPGTPAALTTSYTGNTGGFIGVYDGSIEFFNGYISNLRASNIARYTTSFTPSTTPFTSDANTLLLTCQSLTMVDNSPNYFAITANGATKPLPYNPFGMTNTSTVSYTPGVNSGSMYFDGGGDYLSLPAELALNSNNFTIEGWFYQTAAASGYTVLVAGNAGSTALSLDYASLGGTGTIAFQNGGTNVYTASGLFKRNSWNHIAVVRNNGYISIYYNGVLSAGPSSNTTTSSILRVSYNSAGYEINGYVSDLRITNGIALYTANFYPGAAPATPTQTVGATTYSSSLLLNGTSGGIIDYHSSNDLETAGNTQLAPQDPYGGSYYSNYFNGSSDYLLVSRDPLPNPGNLNVTIEFWIYVTATPSTSGFIYSGTGGTPYGFSISAASNPTISFYYGGLLPGNIYFTTTNTITQNAWHHIAFTMLYSTGAVKMFIDGVLDPSTGTIGAASQMSGNSSMQIGKRADAAASYFPGYVSNLRVTQGQILYTTNFTPPTTPLTATANTKLLTCQSNRFIDNSSNALTLTPAGSAKVQSQNPFQQNTGKSLYFDGTGDYLYVADSPTLRLGSGSFTIEFWLYYNSISGEQLVINKGYIGAGDLLVMTGSGDGKLGVSLSGSLVLTESVGSIAGQWYYYAIVSNGTALTLYKNGVSVSTGTNSTVLNSTKPVGIGGNGDSSAGPLGLYPLNGYIKDLRITKGVARYTTAFTPPTTPDQTK